MYLLLNIIAKIKLNKIFNALRASQVIIFAILVKLKFLNIWLNSHNEVN